MTSYFSSSSPFSSSSFSYSAGKIITKLVKGRGRSSNIREGVAKLEKDQKNTIDAMWKASDEEKERCRASLEKV